MSIGKFASNLILTTSLSNTEILAKVQEQFPSAKTTMACIAWYKSDLRKKGLIAGKTSTAFTKEEKIAALKAQLEALEAVETE
jgi:hypothetical protein